MRSYSFGKTKTTYVMKKISFLCLFVLLFTTLFAQNDPPAKKQQYIRRNVKTFTQTEINELTKAIIAMKNRTSLFDPSINAYDYFAKIHWYALNGETSTAHNHSTSATHGMGHVAHENPGFLPWHREFIRRVEMELKVSTGKPNYTLPYWDWTDRSYDAYIFSDKFMGGDGARGSNYEVLGGAFGKRANQFHVTYQSAFDNPEGGSLYLQRHFGSTPFAKSLPNASDVAQALAIPAYDVYPWNAETNPQKSFRQFWEGFRPIPGVSPTTVGARTHGQVHIYVGGHLLSDSSPNDPLFFLHHCNVDRVFAEWQDRWGTYNFPRKWVDTLHNVTHAWRDVMPPFSSSFRDMLDLRASGVRYDTQRSVLSGSETMLQIEVFPNPTTDLVQVVMQNIEADEVQIKLFSATGLTMQHKPVTVQEKTVQTTLDLENYPPGIYLLQAEYEGRTLAKKVVKQ